MPNRAIISLGGWRAARGLRGCGACLGRYTRGMLRDLLYSHRILHQTFGLLPKKSSLHGGCLYRPILVTIIFGTLHPPHTRLPVLGNPPYDPHRRRRPPTIEFHARFSKTTKSLRHRAQTRLRGTVFGGEIFYSTKICQRQNFPRNPAGIRTDAARTISEGI